MKCRKCNLDKPEICVAVNVENGIFKTELSMCRECKISENIKLFSPAIFYANDFVLCDGVNSHGVDVTGEIMLVKEVNIIHNSVALVWIGHRRDCHLKIPQCKKINKSQLKITTKIRDDVVEIR